MTRANVAISFNSIWTVARCCRRESGKGELYDKYGSNAEERTTLLERRHCLEDVQFDPRRPERILVATYYTLRGSIM